MKSRSRFGWIAVALWVDCCRALGGLLSRFGWIAVALCPCKSLGDNNRTLSLPYLYEGG